MTGNIGQPSLFTITTFMVVMAGSCAPTEKSQMEIYRLPLEGRQIGELQLPTSVERVLSGDGTASELILHSTPHADEELEPISWFFSFIDQRMRVTAIARKSTTNYWVLQSKMKPDSRRIYLPINLDVYSQVALDNKQKRQLGQEAQLVLRFLRGAFDDIDPAREPFKHGGSRAIGYGDFSQPPASELIDPWGDSFLFYLSIGGDALLVTKEGAVAWYQLETNQVIPVGDFEDAVKRYLEFSLDDREFSSWTDIP